VIRGINRQDIFDAPEDYRKFIETLASLREVVSDDMQTKICTCHIYEKKKCYSRGYAFARCQAKTTLQSYGNELRDHQKYSKKNAMKTGTHTQVPLTFASDYRKCSKCLMLNIVIV